MDKPTIHCALCRKPLKLTAINHQWFAAPCECLSVEKVELTPEEVAKMNAVEELEF